MRGLTDMCLQGLQLHCPHLTAVSLDGSFELVPIAPTYACPQPSLRVMRVNAHVGVQLEPAATQGCSRVSSNFGPKLNPTPDPLSSPCEGNNGSVEQQNNVSAPIGVSIAPSGQLSAKCVWPYIPTMPSGDSTKHRQLLFAFVAHLQSIASDSANAHNSATGHPLRKDFAAEIQRPVARSPCPGVAGWWNQGPSVIFWAET